MSTLNTAKKLSVVLPLLAVVGLAGCASSGPTDREIVTRTPYEDRSAMIFSKMSTIYCADKIVTSFSVTQYYGHISCGYPNQMAARYTFQVTDFAQHD